MTGVMQQENTGTQMPSFSYCWTQVVHLLSPSKMYCMCVKNIIVSVGFRQFIATVLLFLKFTWCFSILLTTDIIIAILWHFPLKFSIGNVHICRRVKLSKLSLVFKNVLNNAAIYDVTQQR